MNIVIEDKLHGEPPSRAIWYNVKRDEHDNVILYSQVRNKWIFDNINLLKSKYATKLLSSSMIDIDIHFIVRHHRRTSELLQSFEYVITRVFIDSVDQIRNIKITKEISSPNDKNFKACVHDFKLIVL
jgi:hypothetical protein